MCRILYCLNCKNTKTKITHFLSLSTVHPKAVDGYGIAGFSIKTHRWKMYKTHFSPQMDNHCNEMVDDFADDFIIAGHIRNINAPKDMDPLIRKEIRAKYENTHPFYYRNHIFLHNGHVEDAHLAKNEQWFEMNIAREYWEIIRGRTDSERIFYLLLTIIKKRKWIHRDTDLLENTGHHSPSNPEELRDVIQEWIRIIQLQFRSFIINFVYANKEYSVVGRISKNANPTQMKHNKLYVSDYSDKSSIHFCTEPIDDTMSLVKLGTIYVIHNECISRHVYDIEHYS